MKTKLLLCCSAVFFLTSLIPAERYLLISGVKVPLSKICGDARYSCRATGIGDNEPTSRVYKKERPDGSGKLDGFNYYNLGKSNHPKKYNDVRPIIDLNENEVIIDTAKVNLDLKRDNITDLLIELNATLKKNKVDAEAAANIRNQYKQVLENNLVVKANFITYTISSKVIDNIRDAKDKVSDNPRFVNAYRRLEAKKYPFIRQVIVIEEICQFKENKDVENLLRPILNANIGENDVKAGLIINMTKSNKKTASFNSAFHKKSIYSYGYWNEDWMYKKNTN